MATLAISAIISGSDTSRRSRVVLRGRDHRLRDLSTGSIGKLAGVTNGTTAASSRSLACAENR